MAGHLAPFDGIQGCLCRLFAQMAFLRPEVQPEASHGELKAPCGGHAPGGSRQVDHRSHQLELAASLVVGPVLFAEVAQLPKQTPGHLAVGLGLPFQ